MSLSPMTTMVLWTAKNGLDPVRQVKNEIAPRHEAFGPIAPYPIDPAHLSDTAKRQIHFNRQDIRWCRPHHHLGTVAAERKR
jgi:hypothetical protein